MWKHFRRPNQLQTQLVGLVVLIGLLFLSVLTFKLPERSADVSVESYQLGAFPSGLAFYSGQGASYYYSLSPLNDYFITADGYRMTLLSAESYDSKSFRSSAKPNQLQKIVDTISHYFGVSLPDYAVTRSDNLRYTTKRINNAIVEITRQIDLPKDKKISIAAITLSYDDLTYVFSPTSGSVFSNHSDSEIDWLQQQTNIEITQAIIPSEHQNTRLFTWELESNQVVLFNPGQAGYITVQTSVNQSLLVNPKDRLIEIIETIPPDATSIKSTIHISVHRDLPTIQ